MSDNLEELYKSFDLEYGSQWAGGYGYRCKKCGSATYCEEQFLPCQDQFIPVKIMCSECHIKWKLNIIPNEVVRAKLDS
jgi:hypothetical protein